MDTKVFTQVRRYNVIYRDVYLALGRHQQRSKLSLIALLGVFTLSIDVVVTDVSSYVLAQGLLLEDVGDQLVYLSSSRVAYSRAIVGFLYNSRTKVLVKQDIATALESKVSMFLAVVSQLNKF